jgi:hypothetical protein
VALMHRFINGPNSLQILMVTNIQSKSYYAVFRILLPIILATTVFYTIFSGAFKALHVFYPSV